MSKKIIKKQLTRIIWIEQAFNFKFLDLDLVFISK